MSACNTEEVKFFVTKVRLIFLSLAWGPEILLIFLIRVPMSKSSSMSSIFPLSILFISRTSLIKVSRWSLASVILSRQSETDAWSCSFSFAIVTACRLCCFLCLFHFFINYLEVFYIYQKQQEKGKSYDKGRGNIYILVIQVRGLDTGNNI